MSARSSRPALIHIKSLGHLKYSKHAAYKFAFEARAGFVTHLLTLTVAEASPDTKPWEACSTPQDVRGHERLPKLLGRLRPKLLLVK